VLTSQINNWKAGYLSSLAWTFEAIEERDYQIRADAPKRYKAVSRNPWEVVIIAGHQDNPVALRHKAMLEYFYNNVTVAEGIEANVRGGFPLLVRQMARAVGHRYSNHEIVWRPQNPVFVGQAPRLPNRQSRATDAVALQAGLTASFTWLPLYFFESTKGRLRYIREPYAVDGVEMPDGEWLTTVGDGLLLSSAIAWMYKTMALKDWVIYNGKFGIPGIHGKTDAQFGSAEWDQFVEAVEDFANDWYAVTNKSGEITTIKGEGGATIPMEKLLQKMDDAITRLWRGGDTATQSTEGDGQGVSSQRDEKEILEADDCEVITETLNAQVDPFVIRWYDGDGVTPLAYIKVKPPQKQNAAIELSVDTGLKALGVTQDPEALAERYGRTVSEVEEPDETADLPRSGRGEDATDAGNYDPSQPRDEEGQWTDDGAGGGSGNPFATATTKPSRRKYTIDQADELLKRRGLTRKHGTEIQDGRIVSVFEVTDTKTGKARKLSGDQMKLLLTDIEERSGRTFAQRDFAAANVAPDKLTAESRQLLAAALATDLAPVAARLETILAINDDATMLAELKALAADLPGLMPEKNPAAAAVLEKIIGTKLIEGLTEKDGGQPSAVSSQPAKE
jgi:hypothetical protein